MWVRSGFFLLAFTSVLAASPDFQAPGGGSIRVEPVERDRVNVTSDYWRLEFDLRNGGILDGIVFLHGSRKNLLVEPLRTYVDAWSDSNAPNTQFRSSREGNVERLEFSGQMAASGREPSYGGPSRPTARCARRIRQGPGERPCCLCPLW